MRVRFSHRLPFQESAPHGAFFISSRCISSGFFHARTGEKERRTARKGANMTSDTKNVEQVEPHGTETQDVQQAEPEKDWESEYKKLLEQSRKWESRAKENAAKAKEFDEMKRSKMSDQELAKEAEQRAAAAESELERMKADYEREKVVSEVSEATGVPASLLRGDTREEIEAHAAAIQSFSSNRPSAHVFASDGKRAGKSPKTPKDDFAAFIAAQM